MNTTCDFALGSSVDIKAIILDFFNPRFLLPDFKIIQVLGLKKKKEKNNQNNKGARIQDVMT